MDHQFAIGDRVCFSREFLRNTGQFTGWAPFTRGRVAAIDKLGENQAITVRWNDGEVSRALNLNLIHTPDIAKEPQ